MGASFERIIIIMLENSTRQDVLSNTYMRKLRKKGVSLANAYGVTHSSQPNYIASTGGDTLGFLDDTPGYAKWIYSKPSDDPQPPPVNHIADLLEAQGLTWKNYAEDMPVGYTAECAKYYHGYTAECAKLYPGILPIPSATPSFLPTTPPIPPDQGHFARKHVPFLSYPNVVTNPDRLANIVHADQFEKDLNAGTLPHYSWYTPNMIHDGHSLTADQKKADPKDTNRHTNIANIATFLEGFLGEDPVAKFPAGTLIVVTFDEA